ncbi:hypothetical protein E3N88_27777 [Mikania micrantha]|uniref:Uncharacterized protein n=1 Tax=Mikania micrantha TaxID=192012 RepID=A0A5N6MYL2_9ASTR|nr:hypothetical protein E3N88_27777 [Mikania micrantha]
MDPQLLPPFPAAEFNFDSTSTSPYATAPSSPKILFPKFYKSPINPEDLRLPDPLESSGATHVQNEEDVDQGNMDFAFDFSGQLEPPSISDADELFDAGKIKPLKPPNETLTSSTAVPKRNINQETFQRGREFRERSTTGHMVLPMRVSDEEQKQVSTIQSSLFGFTWYNKWNLKNLLLFRSTSEGSAVITKDVKNSMSFRSSDGCGGSVDGSSRRMKRKMSAHEIHYTANRAVAEKMRRKTFLPYKSGLLMGCCCLGFSHGHHEGSRRG